MFEPKYVDIYRLLSMDSKQVIGNVDNVFNTRKTNDPFVATDLDQMQYRLQWRSFYDGWIEGRMALLKELMNRGKQMNPEPEQRTFRWEYGRLIPITDDEQNV